MWPAPQIRLMAKALGLPNQTIRLGHRSGSLSVFDHIVMVLTQKPLGASDLKGGRYKLVVDFDKD